MNADAEMMFMFILGHLFYFIPFRIILVSFMIDLWIFSYICGRG